MTQSLRDRAQANSQPSAEPGETVTAIAALPNVEYTDPIRDAETVPVAVAWGRVMADVQSITKADQRNDTGGRYAFRGVDRVVNAVGPALRRHGVLVLPVGVYDVAYTESKTKSGGTMQECTLKVRWAVFGPMGDQLPVALESAGQAQDTQDKATSKAVSVAQRVLFLTSLHVPTQDPDIDRGYDRGDRPLPKAADYRDEIVDPRTSLSRLGTIKGELLRHDLGMVTVTNEVGDEEPLGKLLMRIGRDREKAAKPNWDESEGGGA